MAQFTLEAETAVLLRQEIQAILHHVNTTEQQCIDLINLSEALTKDGELFVTVSK